MRFIAAGGETMEDLEARQMDLMLRLVEKYGDFGDLKGRIGTGTHSSSYSGGHVVVGNFLYFGIVILIIYRFPYLDWRNWSAWSSYPPPAVQYKKGYQKGHLSLPRQ